MTNDGLVADNHKCEDLRWLNHQLNHHFMEFLGKKFCAHWDRFWCLVAPTQSKFWFQLKMINKKLFASKIGEKKILNVSFLIIVYKCNFPKFYEKGGIRTTLLIKTVQKKNTYLGKSTYVRMVFLMLSVLISIFFFIISNRIFIYKDYFKLLL